MVREVLSISVGQCGIQMGDIIWQNYCAEHEIDKEGNRSHEVIRWRKSGPTKYRIRNHQFQCFFEETGSGQYVPRSLMVDLEPNVIDDIKISKYSKIYNNDFLLSGTEDAANIFARGHYTVGKQMIDKVNDRLRKLVDNCDNVQGFIMNHGIAGGTGSGLGCLILERIAVDYRKKSKLGFTVYPSPTISTNVVDPYNSLLSTHWLLDYNEMTSVMDNEAIYEICQKMLDIKRPTYDDINRLIAKPISSLTAGLRYPGQLNVDLNEYQTSLVAFPRLHFHVTSFSPITTKQKKLTISTDVRSITSACFDAANFMVKIADFDPEEDKYMSISVNYRGKVFPKEANSTVQWLKTNKKVTFVEWCPTGFKVGIHDEVHCILPNDPLATFNKTITMSGNSTAISRVFSERISKKYDLLYSQRAFVHWFVGEGMEEGEFDEAREDLGFLEKDYLDVLSEQATDDVDDDDDDDDY